MHLPPLSRRFAPDVRRVTDKQHDTQKAAGELQGRARRGEHTDGRNKQRGRGGGRGHSRRHTAATEHTAGAGAEDKRREGRKEGRREGRGWPRAWGGREEHGSRQGAGREQTEVKKRYINI